MVDYVSEPVHAAARAVRRTGWFLTALALVPLTCAWVATQDRPEGGRVLANAVIVLGGGFGVPAVALFALAPLIDRGALWATITAMAITVLPAVAVSLAFVVAPIGGPFCMTAVAIVPLYALIKCWDAIGELRDLRRKRPVRRGFEPIMPYDPTVTGPSRMPTAVVSPRKTVLPPRPRLAPPRDNAGGAPQP